MAARRGDQAREAIKNKIIEVFNAEGNYVAFIDKKIYVQAKDGPGGETIQFAITMTMPKTPVESGTVPAATPANSNDWTGESAPVPQAPAMPTELSPTDRAKIEELKAKLGVK